MFIMFIIIVILIIIILIIITAITTNKKLNIINCDYFLVLFGGFLPLQYITIGSNNMAS